MGWSGGNYSKGNAATGGWAGDASLGIGIEAGRHDTQDNDFATGINQCINKDGSNAFTGNPNLGGYIPTNLGAGTAAAPALCVNNDTNTGVFAPAADTWAVATGGVQKLNIDVNGSTEILRSGPGFDLTISKFESGAQGAVLVLRKSDSNTIGTNVLVGSGDSVGEIYFKGANGTGYTDAAVIAAQVDGAPGASNDMPGRLVFYTTPDGSGTFAERMRIDRDGRVGVGAIPFFNAQFYVKSTISTNAAGRFYVDVASTDLSTPALYLDKKDNDNTTSQVFLQATINSQGTGNGQINGNGASQLAFGTFSDVRLKENIIDLPSQLANIFALRPVEFDYKDGTGHQIGFIAQEVREIYPDLVAENNDGYLTLSGLGKNEARMIKAFQEFAQIMQAKVEALEAQVEMLQTQVAVG
jgi:hypothetical protein